MALLETARLSFLFAV